MDRVFIIWDEQDGYRCDHVYKDRKTAEFALKLLYTDHWILHEMVRVEAVEVVSMGEE